MYDDVVHRLLCTTLQYNPPSQMFPTRYRAMEISVVDITMEPFLEPSAMFFLQAGEAPPPQKTVLFTSMMVDVPQLDFCTGIDTHLQASIYSVHLPTGSADVPMLITDMHQGRFESAGNHQWGTDFDFFGSRAEH